MVTHMQDDALRLQKRFGYVDTSELKKINRRYTGLNQYEEKKRPLNL